MSWKPSKHSWLASFSCSRGKGVNLVLWTDDEERIVRFRLSGHAGYADHGQDIVCAAISALAISAVNGLEHFMKKPPLCKEGNGELECTLQAENVQELEQAQWILRTMALGLKDIQQSYGHQYLKIEYRRWTPC